MSQVSTIVITPNDDNGYLNIIAEIDRRNAGYNAGKTQFKWSDDLYLLLYYGAQDVTLSAGTTAGSIALRATETITVTEVVTFSNSKNASPSKPISALGSITWFGSAPQNRRLDIIDGNFNLTYTGSGVEPEVGVFIGQVTYTSKANVYKLTLPTKAASNNNPDFQVVAWFKAEAN
ncbi:MAG: hypothetical protein JSU84_06985 [Thiotrichales bacterium]|nr:MAG: hypothetical protein JSU84_06985 [Thiotrichales bacterium]